MKQFSCSACAKKIKINHFGFAECACAYADPRDLDAGYSFLPRDLPETWRPNRPAICNAIDLKYSQYIERQHGEPSSVTISLGDFYNPE